jgi:hypothetical protein
MVIVSFHNPCCIVIRHAIVVVVMNHNGIPNVAQSWFEPHLRSRIGFNDWCGLDCWLIIGFGWFRRLLIYEPIMLLSRTLWCIMLLSGTLNYYLNFVRSSVRSRPWPSNGVRTTVLLRSSIYRVCIISSCNKKNLLFVQSIFGCSTGTRGTPT